MMDPERVGILSVWAAPRAATEARSVAVKSIFADSDCSTANLGVERARLKAIETAILIPFAHLQQTFPLLNPRQAFALVAGEFIRWCVDCSANTPILRTHLAVLLVEDGRSML